MVNKELNKILLREMFNTIREYEIKNIKTQKLDDKQMVNVITDYIDKKVRKEKFYED